MKGQKAYITGGSRGIGRGIVEVLSDDGYDIAFTYNSKQEEAEALAERVRAKGVRCFCYQASLERPEVPEATAGRALEDLGGMDLLVANAGLTRKTSITKMDAAFLDFLYGLNYRSYLLSAAAASRHMIGQGVKGNIIFIASTRGFRAYPDDSLYGGLKAAVIRSTESIALELAPHGIRVNCVAPGATAVRGTYSREELTQGFGRKIPMGRFGTPGEVGELVKFIASDKASYMTGNTIKLDGGLILPGRPEVP